MVFLLTAHGFLALLHHSVAVCFISELRCFTYSVPSPAFSFMILRVSSPDFGATACPIPTPTPSPSKKLESPFLSIFLPFKPTA